MKKVIVVLVILLLLIKPVLAVDFVSCPDNLRVFQGNCSSFNIDVKNPTNQTLKRVSPKIKYVEFGNLTVTPSYADIPPKSHKTFKVTICANSTAYPLNYPIFLGVRTDSLTYAKIINVEVVKKVTEVKSENETETGKPVEEPKKHEKPEVKSNATMPTKAEDEKKKNVAVLIALPILVFGIILLLKLNPLLVSMLSQKEKVSVRDLIEDPRKFEGKNIELKCELFLQKSGSVGSIFKLYDGTGELLAYYPKSFSVKIMGSGSVRGILYIYKGKPLFSIHSIKWSYWIPKEG